MKKSTKLALVAGGGLLVAGGVAYALTRTPSTAAAKISQTGVTVRATPLLAAPNSGANVVAQEPANETVTLLTVMMDPEGQDTTDITNGWYKAKDGAGNTGFLFAQDVSAA
jgi:hypothetical protein